MYCLAIKVLPGGCLKRYGFRSLMTAPPAGVKTRGFQLTFRNPKSITLFAAVVALFVRFLRLKLAFLADLPSRAVVSVEITREEVVFFADLQI